MPNIYDPAFVQQLFDEMASSYEAVNYVSSFGYSHRWRRQFVEKAAIRPEMTVCDLMCGMGECWGAITPYLGQEGRIMAQDFSQGMLRGAKLKRSSFATDQIYLSQQNGLSTSLRDESIDAVICGFGVKTLSREHLGKLAAELWRILKPGGTFSFIEVSVPSGWVLEKPYLFYLKEIVPVVGRLLLGNPENYRMLGEYTERFGNCGQLGEETRRVGLQTTYQSYFWGCATGVSGRKPTSA